MSLTRKSGAMDWFILNFVPCPNCSSRLEARSVKRKWNNVFCTMCAFACRFATANQDYSISRMCIFPKDLKAMLAKRTLLPPLIIHYKWTDNDIEWEKVIFFPFIASRFFEEQQQYPVPILPGEACPVLYPTDDLPSMILYEQPSYEDIAEIASRWSNVYTSRIQRMFRMGYGKASLIREMAMALRRKRGVTDVEESNNSDDFDSSFESESDE